MKKIIITGGNGQLATCLKELVKGFNPTEYNILFKTSKELDITNINEIASLFNDVKPDVIINCAAYTDVENAETIEGENYAYNVNYKGVKNLIACCERLNTHPLLVHISTDYVFDGKMNTPYKTSDPCVPINNYGKTKLKGEEELLKSGCNFIIIRTSWLYSKHGKNFFTKMLNKLLNAKNKTFKAPIDEISVPTNAYNLAKFILNLILGYLYCNSKYKNIYHYVDNGIASRYDFLFEIFDTLVKKGKIDETVKIVPCKNNEFITKAKRPQYSVMDNSCVIETFNEYHIEDWRTSVRKEIEKIICPCQNS